MYRMMSTPTLDDMARTLQIRDVPDDLHRTLRTRAAAAGMSLSDYALAALSEVAARPSASDVLRLARSRAGGAPLADVVAAVRHGHAEK